MPDDGNHLRLDTRTDAVVAHGVSRPDRPALVAFTTDAQSEEALEDGLAELLPDGKLDLRRGGVRAAIAAMQKEATPRVLVVDVSGEEQPLSALGDLAHVVEPDVCVLVIGDLDGVDLYREVTRGLGAADYLAKPLTHDRVARHFGMLVRGQTSVSEALLGGRSVAVTGVRGGVGTTTIAANLAWHFGVMLRRHSVLLDPDLHLGAAAFLLNVNPGSGLRMALESPERIDTLLAERAALPVRERLHVLAGEEKAAVMPAYAEGAASALLDALRSRYNFIVADVPFVPLALYRDLLDQVHQRVLVMEPTLAAVRDALRLLALPSGPRQNQRAVLVLNRIGIPGGLTRHQVEDALKIKVDVAIPDLPRQMNQAAILGEPAITSSSSFRTAMLELARQVAFLGVLDSSAGSAPHAASRGRPSRWRLFGGRQ
jgi:pilus assembly protein CpaE